MSIFASAFLIVGAFLVVAIATALPISPWLTHIGAAPRTDIAPMRSPVETPPSVR
jgi:hypothetical protein